MQAVCNSNRPGLGINAHAFNQQTAVAPWQMYGKAQITRKGAFSPYGNWKKPYDFVP
jgi:hypothetical protein